MKKIKTENGSILTVYPVIVGTTEIGFLDRNEADNFKRMQIRILN